MAAWLVVLVIAVPWLGAICLWLLGDRHPNRLHALASAFAVVGALVALGLLLVIGAEPVVSIPLGGVFGEFTLVPDGLGVYLALIAAIVGGLAVVFSNDYMRGEAQLSRYYALTLLFIGAMIGLVLSGSLLFMFLFWEITAFCSYALISFHNDDPKAVAGGIKALVITSLGGIGLLAGAILSYTYLGSYQVNTFLAEAGTLPARVLGLVAFGCLAAAAAKSAQVPFQTWLPDAMEAPTPISALIHAATMVNAGVYLLARFYPAFEAVPGWKTAVMVVGLLSALLAALMALFCTDLKRTLAFSTISQLGFMVYAIGVGGFFASQFHLLSHSVFKALLFLGAGAVIHAAGTRDLMKLGGLGKQMPVVRAVFIVGALALAGLPITNGFFSKELVLEAGLAHGPGWAYLIMFFIAGLTGLYTLRLVMLVFYGPPTPEIKVHDAPGAMRVSLLTLAFLTLTTWVLVGALDHILASTLPYHNLEPESASVILGEILTSASTWITVGFVLFMASIWFWRDRFQALTHRLSPLINFINVDFGFEWLNVQISRLTVRAAAALQVTQTGLLSWNVVAIVAGLVLLLVIISWGG